MLMRFILIARNGLVNGLNGLDSMAAKVVGGFVFQPIPGESCWSPSGVGTAEVSLDPGTSGSAVAYMVVDGRQREAPQHGTCRFCFLSLPVWAVFWLRVPDLFFAHNRRPGAAQAERGFHTSVEPVPGLDPDWLDRRAGVGQHGGHARGRALGEPSPEVQSSAPLLLTVGCVAHHRATPGQARL